LGGQESNARAAARFGTAYAGGSQLLLEKANAPRFSRAHAHAYAWIAPGPGQDLDVGWITSACFRHQ
jgi:hypothetical protein